MAQAVTLSSAFAYVPVHLFPMDEVDVGVRIQPRKVNKTDHR